MPKNKRNPRSGFLSCTSCNSLLLRFMNAKRCFAPVGATRGVAEVCLQTSEVATQLRSRHKKLFEKSFTKNFNYVLGQAKSADENRRHSFYLSAFRNRCNLAMTAAASARVIPSCGRKFPVSSPCMMPSSAQKPMLSTAKAEILSLSA